MTTPGSDDLHASCGQPWAVHKGGSRLGACPGGTVTKIGVPIMKATAATFAQLQASSELGTWLTPALDTLASVVWAAMYPGDDAEITDEQRLAAVAVSVDEFKEALVLKIGEAMGAQQPAEEPVAKKSTWSGILAKRSPAPPVRKGTGGGTWDGIL